MALLHDDLHRRVARLAGPALGTLAIEPLYVLVDTAIVGRLGADVLAGLGVAAVVLLTVTSLAGFLQYAVTPDVAFAEGAGRPQEARRAASDSLVIGVGLGLVAAALVAGGADALARVIGGEADVRSAAVTYMRISAIGLPFVMVAYVGHGVMRGLNLLRRPLVIVAVSSGVNVALEVVFVIVLDLGIAGSAWSTVIAQVIGAVWFLAVLRPHLARAWPTWACARRVLLAGAHLGLRTVAMLAAWISVAVVAARVDTATLAANHVLTELFVFLALVLDAFAIPAQSLVAGALGAGDHEQAVRVGRACVRLSVWSAAALAALLAVTSPIAPMAFSGDGDVRSRLTAGLLILAVIQIPGAFAFALDGALIGARDQRFLGRVAVLNLLAFAPLLLLTLAVPSVGIVGLWGAQLSWMVMRATVNHRRFAARSWQSGPAPIGASIVT